MPVSQTQPMLRGRAKGAVRSQERRATTSVISCEHSSARRETRTKTGQNLPPEEYSGQIATTRNAHTSRTSRCLPVRACPSHPSHVSTMSHQEGEDEEAGTAHIARITNAPAKLVAAYPVGHLLRRRRRRRHLPRPTAYARRRFVSTEFLPTLLDFCCFLHRGEHVHSEVLVVVACGFHAQ